MTTLAWWHCFAGIAGDMALASAIDAGAAVDDVVGLLRRLPLSGWSLDVSETMRNGIGATTMEVTAGDERLVRTHAHVIGLIEEARLPDRVRDRSLAAFAVLAEAEGYVHRRPASQVHFHEVGAVDAIVDIVGTCAALEVLGVDEVHVSAIATGTGVVRTAHGVLPNPAPAVVHLLKGMPTFGRSVNVELATPTGVALMRSLAVGYGQMPAMTVAATGVGAGSRELPELPNLAQIVIGEAAATATPGQPVTLLEVNVDDATGEVLAHAVAALLEAGAHDAWITPVLMKKGRPGHIVSALCDGALARRVAEVLTTETGSLGVRGQVLDRWPQPRSHDAVNVDGGMVRVKVGPGRVKPEFDDARRVALRSARPLRQVLAEVEAIGARSPKPDDDGPEDRPAS
jgi:uncharacterized protein (TIGR00299 family) protein